MSPPVPLDGRCVNSSFESVTFVNQNSATNAVMYQPQRIDIWWTPPLVMRELCWMDVFRERTSEDVVDNWICNDVRWSFRSELERGMINTRFLIEFFLKVIC